MTAFHFPRGRPSKLPGSSSLILRPTLPSKSTTGGQAAYHGLRLAPMTASLNSKTDDAYFPANLIRSYQPLPKLRLCYFCSMVHGACSCCSLSNQRDRRPSCVRRGFLKLVISGDIGLGCMPFPRLSIDNFSLDSRCGLLHSLHGVSGCLVCMSVSALENALASTNRTGEGR